MAVERTISIIKPDAVAKTSLGDIYNRFEKGGLRVGRAYDAPFMQQAGAFYAVHKERPFCRDLVDSMTSGPVMVQVLEGRERNRQNRRTDGRDELKDAAPGTIRADHAKTVDENAVARLGRSRIPAAAEIVLFPEGVCEQNPLSARLHDRRIQDKTCSD